MSNQRAETIDLGDISLIEVPYRIGGNDYVLKEADGEATCAYRNAVFKATELGPDGTPVRIRNMADVEPLLVSLCLFNEDGRRIDQNFIRKWPNRIQKALYDKVKEISQLDEPSPLKGQLESALSLDNSPCSFERLQDFVEKLPDDQYKALKKFVEIDSEQSAKNAQKGTQDG